MTEENISNLYKNNKAIIFAAAVVVVVVVLMYFHDKGRQRVYELQRLERRVELLEDWGRPKQNTQWNTTSPPPTRQQW